MNMERDLSRTEVAVSPCPKPRMTQRDKWYDREATRKYRAFKKAFVLKCKEQGLKDLPEQFGISFEVPMPQSWSEKKKVFMEGTAHKQRPDLDNLIKAVKDSLAKEDSHVHTYLHAQKVWARTGRIIIFTSKDGSDGIY